MKGPTHPVGPFCFTGPWSATTGAFVSLALAWRGCAGFRASRWVVCGLGAESAGSNADGPSRPVSARFLLSGAENGVRAPEAG